MKKIVVGFILASLFASPVAAKNHDSDRSKSSEKRSTTTTTVVPASDSPSRGNAGKDNDSSSKGNSAGTNKPENSGNSGNGGNNESQGGTKSNGKSKAEVDNDAGKNSGEPEESDTQTSRTYIVRFVSNVKAADAGKKLIDNYNIEVIDANIAARKAASSSRTSAKLQTRGTYKMAFEKVLNAAVIEVPLAAIAGLERNPQVLSIEEDASVSVDPISVSQDGATWGLDRLDQRVLPLTGTFSSPSTASNVFAYVVDTGIDGSHAEFGGRVGAGYDGISGGTGANDCNGHGTHVAGTIASSTYGVAKSAQLVPVRVLGCDGSGTYAGVIAGLDWIAKNRPSTQRAVVNMSLGGGASSSLDSAVASLVSSGVAVVVAAGNSNVDACTVSPARAASAITVGATTISDARSSFSNFGSCLDIFAPGSNITSTIPGGGTAIYSGTSMAAPHVAGVAAVVLSLNAMSPTQLAAHLVETATGGLVGGAGTSSPNLLAYLSGTTSPTNPTAPSNPGTPATAPAQPAAPLAEARNKSAVVSWVLPDNGGSALSVQTIRTYADGRVVYTTRVDGTATSTTVRRLKGNVDYSFTVQATNAIGASAESAQSNTVRPIR